MKNKITRIANFNGTINYFKLENIPDLNINLCRLFSKLGFNSEKENELDRAYTEFAETYFFVTDKNIKVHVFITSENVHLIIDSEIERNKLNQTIKKYFEFPT